MTWYEHERQEKRVNREEKLVELPRCAPELWPEFRDYLMGRGLNPVLAMENAWYPTTRAQDTYPRIVIPARRSDGKCFWQARAMNAAVQKRYQSPSGSRGDAVVVVSPRYKPPASRVFAVITEGPMDALAVAGLGGMGIALMGNTPNAAIIEHLANLTRPATLIVVVADSDSVSAATRTMTWLGARTGKRLVLWVPYPYKDFAAMPPGERQRRFPF